MDRAHRHLVAALKLAVRNSDPGTTQTLAHISKSLRDIAAGITPQFARCSRPFATRTTYLLPYPCGPAPHPRARCWGETSLKSRQTTHHQYQWRQLSSGTAPAPSEYEKIKAKFVRFFALFMMVAAGVRVFPWVAASSVGNSLGLLGAEEPFLQKSGISRLLLVLRMSDGGRERAVKGGAVPLVLRLVPHEDMALVDGALQALEALGERGEGLEAIREAGGEAVLQEYLRRTAKSPLNEDAVYRAHTLLQELQRAKASQGGGGGQ